MEDCVYAYLYSLHITDLEQDSLFNFWRPITIVLTALLSIMLPLAVQRLQGEEGLQFI